MGLLALTPADPAGAKLFTIDGNSNDFNDTDGSDDIAFTFMSSNGLVSGTIRAVDIQVSAATLELDVDTYIGFSAVPLDFSDMDVLIFDVVLDGGSAVVDQLGVAVATDPLATNPDGGGWLDNCDLGTEIGCVSAVTNDSVPNAGAFASAAVELEPGNLIFGFPGAAIFNFDWLGLSTGNLEAGETTRRLFVAWDDTGSQSPLSKDGQQAVFMFSGGTNADFAVDIVPEPGTGLLVAVGLTALGMARRRQEAAGA